METARQEQETMEHLEKTRREEEMLEKDKSEKAGRAVQLQIQERHLTSNSPTSNFFELAKLHSGRSTKDYK